MRQFIANILKFGALAGAFYLVALFAFGTIFPWRVPLANLNYPLGSGGHMYTRLKEAKGIGDIDILFLGSSKAYRGFDTRIFENAGYSSFNFGSSAQTPLQTELLLERYLSGINPKLVVYEVYPLTLNREGVESALDINANSEIDLETLEMVLELGHLKPFNAFLYGLMRDVLNMNDDFQEPAVQEEDTYVQGGYVEREMSYFRHQKVEKKVWPTNEEQSERFIEIIDMFKKRNIPVVLVNSPLTSSLYNSYTNNEEVDQKMGQLAPYYNFNELMNLDDSLYFYDASHLNQKGVEQFNHKLIEVLEKDNLLSRDD